MKTHTAPIVLVAHHRETCGGLLPGLLERLGPVLRVHPLDGEPLPDLRGVRGAVVMGSHHGVHDAVDGLRQERQWVEGAMAMQVPMLGICFGAQLIGQICGARVARGPAPEHGCGQIVPCRGQDLLTHTMQVMHWHRDGIFNLPSHVQRIALGAACYPEQVFQAGSAIGVQFHPETTPDMLSRWLRCPDASYLDDQRRNALFADLERMTQMRHWLGGLLDRMFQPKEL